MSETYIALLGIVVGALLAGVPAYYRGRGDGFKEAWILGRDITLGGEPRGKMLSEVEFPPIEPRG